MSVLWHWFVAAGTLAFLAANVWLIVWSARQGPLNVADDDMVGHVWDGDLEERNNPAPRWWLYLYYITIVWAVGYMIVYPGLGTFGGTLGWSQAGQYEAEMQAAADRYEPIYERFAAMNFAALQQDEDARQLGKSLFASYCTTCHGSDARGATGYPNLTDDDWLWGNNESQLTTSISRGRIAAMPNLSPALGGDSGIDNMVNYVRSLSGLVDGDATTMTSKPLFTAMCSTCHGATAEGNPIFGAPNLTDDIWLYGSSEQAVRTTITEGRNGVMPAHGELLGSNRTKILAAYVASLEQQQ